MGRGLVRVLCAHRTVGYCTEALELAAREAARDADELEVEKERERRKIGPVERYR